MRIHLPENFKLVEPTEWMLGWTAGVIDGEGTVTIIPHLPKNTTGKFRGFQVMVCACNTDLAMIVRLQQMWGGGYYIDKRGVGNRATIYRWQVNARKALHLLKSILPYMITKSKQAEIAIELQERIVSQVGFEGRRKFSGGLSSEEKEVRTVLYNRIKALNIKPGVREMLKRQTLSENHCLEPKLG